MPERPDQPDPDLMAETIADAPAIRPAAKPKSQGPSKPQGDPALDDTAVDLEIAGEPRPIRPRFDAPIDDIYDKPDPTADASSLTRFDPERGKTNVAIKIRAATEALRNSVTTPFGKLIWAIAFALAGISLTIAAITLKDTPYVIAAIIVTPVGALLVHWRYQAWLGHKRYMYRLLETLGEDMTDFDPRQKYRRIGSKIGKSKP